MSVSGMISCSLEAFFFLKQETQSDPIGNYIVCNGSCKIVYRFSGFSPNQGFCWQYIDLDRNVVELLHDRQPHLSRLTIRAVACFYRTSSIWESIGRSIYDHSSKTHVVMLLRGG